ncbi:hypothetical protein CB1_000735003 [Camelus ferus]|nr:hypothetical protein CB1_000735003 [Camelus ferus]
MKTRESVLRFWNTAGDTDLAARAEQKAGDNKTALLQGSRLQKLMPMRKTSFKMLKSSVFSRNRGLKDVVERRWPGCSRKLKAKRAPGGGEETLSGGELRGALAPETTHDEDLDRQHNTEKGKLYKIRILQARRNQERAILPRKTDEVPSRAELIQ